MLQVYEFRVAALPHLHTTGLPCIGNIVALFMYLTMFICVTVQYTPPTPPTPTPPPRPTPVSKGVDSSKCPPKCAPGLLCDGTKCVPPKECPCVLPSGQLLPVSNHCVFYVMYHTFILTCSYYFAHIKQTPNVVP